jgi:hypothetical protein
MLGLKPMALYMLDKPSTTELRVFILEKDAQVLSQMCLLLRNLTSTGIHPFAQRELKEGPPAEREIPF